MGCMQNSEEMNKNQKPNQSAMDMNTRHMMKIFTEQPEHAVNRFSNQRGKKRIEFVKQETYLSLASSVHLWPVLLVSLLQKNLKKMQ
jgi:hypothetical protein